MNHIAAPAGLSAAPPLHIEFFGLPGSGKTTVARELHALLARGRPAFEFSPRLLHDEAGTARRAVAKAALIARELSRDRDGRRVMLRALEVPQPTLRDAARSVFTLGTVIALYRHLKRRNQPAVLDQGLLQALWSIRLRTCDERGRELAADLMDGVVRSSRVHVLVGTPPGVCAGRLRDRASRHSRLQRAGAVDDGRAWKEAERLRLTLSSDLRAAYRARDLLPQILEIDGRDDPVEAAITIARLLPFWQKAPGYCDPPSLELGRGGR